MRSARDAVVLLTCEHGGNRVPREYLHLFRGAERLLATHRGLDIGAAGAAAWLARRLDCPLVSAHVTRLVVDLNRSPGHRALFSSRTRQLPQAVREELLQRYYRPYRELVTSWITAQVASGVPVIHLSVHSFTPRLRGHTRNADIGLLYDPARPAEQRFCREWGRHMAGEERFRVRLNYPYRGTSDGFVTTLRGALPVSRYLGIEIEINQARLAPGPERLALLRLVARSLPLAGDGALRPAGASAGPRGATGPRAPARHRSPGTRC